MNSYLRLSGGAPIQSRYHSILFRDVLHLHRATHRYLHAFLQAKGKTSYDIVYMVRTMSGTIYIANECSTQPNNGSGKPHALNSTIATAF